MMIMMKMMIIMMIIIIIKKLIILLFLNIINNNLMNNDGKKWSDVEIKSLIQFTKNKENIDNISLNLKRSTNSINNKLKNIAINLINIFSIDINIVSNIINIPCNIINSYINNNDIDNDNMNNDNIDDDIILNEKQQKIIDEFKLGKNIFITGPAGTGKSITIKEIIKYCKNNNISYGLTATTGSAAVLINGKIINSYLGVGICDKTASELYSNNVYKLSHIVKKIRNLKVLIIDEISMLDLKSFELISEYLSLITKNKKPFGNIQLVLTGDFCQLEPVNKNFCFLSEIWEQLNLEIIFLSKMIRQQHDKQFQKILKNLRYGICSDETFELLKNNKYIINEDIKSTILYSKNEDVEKINNIEHQKLLNLNKSNIYKIRLPNEKKNKQKTESWFNKLDIPDSIELCENEQIVITSNINQDKCLINGTRGIIKELLLDSIKIKTIDNNIHIINYHKCIYNEDKDMYFSYMPIKLAYALSIHKSQGMTLDSIEIDIGKNIFASGQAYTALSRAKKLENIKIIDICKESFILNQKVLNFYSKIDSNLII